MELTRLHKQLVEGVKDYIDAVKPTIKNSNLGYLITHNDKTWVYNLQVAEVDSFPVWKCVGGNTPPKAGCGYLLSQNMLIKGYDKENNEFKYRDEPVRCPFCDGTEFQEYESVEEWRENYG
jgi:hypothetical protein